MKNKFKILALGTLTAFLGVSCNDFLDELPDNRTVLDNESKIQKILVSAYPLSSYALVTELSSDNIDDYGTSNPYSDRFWEQAAYWEQITEVDNDDLKSVWEACYTAISNANEALKAMEELGYPSELNASRGEALLARAYNHFILVNVFCNHYNTQTSNSDLGIPYMEEAETTLNPKYERGTVAEVYEKINADIEVGISLINSEIYEVPKYHFNESAAYAFAARFNLYYEKWQKAVNYATKALGSNPKSVLRDWGAMGSLPRTPSVVANNYIGADKKANFLMHTDASNIGLIFGPYYTGSRFNHIRLIANRETLFANGPWGVTGGSSYKYRPFVYTATNLDKTLYIKTPYIFQYTNQVAGIGYRRSVNVAFTSDETLLVRAEANIMLKNYSEGVADLNMWAQNFYNLSGELTQDNIETFYEELSYSTADMPTQKKTLNPKFTLESGTQENLIHCALQFRRILTLHEGLRWFDIRRYGIVVNRYIHEQTGARNVADVLTVDDLRRTLQLPQDVIDAGLTANPR